ncbi:MAG: type IV pilus assembly protein PilM [Acidimicrobiales bacterium]
MAEHHIGLDIGSFAVRAAEVSGDPGNLMLHRFSQLTLPPGAVVDGEIIDPAAVAATIRSLWEKGGFKGKKVTVGIANRWVKVREAEVASLSPAEVRTSLRFEAQEVIPFADEDAIVDFVVQDTYTTEDGVEMMKFLVVAAQRQMVSTTLDVVRRAGLIPDNVDLTPFALVRALAPVPQPGVSEAVVSIGAGLTNVVVHTGGTPRLVRMTPRAGSAVTENVSKALGVERERAEALKRGAAVAVADPQLAAAADVVASELTPLVQEIQGSLDYFLAQTDDVELKRLVLTGAGAKMAGLRARLATELRVPVEMASPLEYIKLGRTGLTEEQLTAAAPVLAAPVGLALASMASPATRLTSLVPEEFHEAAAFRRQKVVAVAAVAAVAVGLGGLWTLRQTQVADARNDAKQAVAVQVALEQKVAKLIPIEQEAADVESRRGQIVTALSSDVDMVALLDTVTAALPNDVSLGSIAIAITPGDQAAASDVLGTLTVSGTGLSHDSTAHWITKMRELGILSSVWTPNSTKGDPLTSFSGQAQITNTAKSARSFGYERPVAQ